jgi:hypothetical protein
MATGRDAADVAITTTFGQSWLRKFEVVSYEVQNAGGMVAGAGAGQVYGMTEAG